VTVRAMIGAMLRRWYVTVAVVLLAVMLAGFLMSRSGVYSTRTVISFTLPDQNSISSDSGTTDPNLIAFASAVAYEINDGKHATLYSEGDAPFYGAGVRQGILVGLNNEGSQWVTEVSKAEIQIQIVGETPAWVEHQQEEYIARVLDTAANAQTPAGSSDSHIVANVVPLTLKIEHIIPSRVALVSAIAALAVASLLVAGWVSALLDRRMRRRRGSTVLERHRLAAAGGTP